MRTAAVAVLTVVASTLASAQASHTICELQAFDSQGLSPLVGEMVDVEGVVTYPPGYTHPLFTIFFMQEGDCGVDVFCPDQLPFELGLGDSVHVHGELQEYISGTGAGANTEIVVENVGDIQLLSQGHPAPEPADMSNSAIQDEWNEDRLVRATGVVSDTNYDYFIWLWDGVSTLQVYTYYNDYLDFSVFEEGDTVRVTGVLVQYDREPPYLEGYELAPRFQSDLEHWHISPVAATSWSSIKALFR
jgi:hypothetical protein